MTDDRTTFLDLPLPHEENDLEADVLRLRSSFQTLDAFIKGLKDDLTALDDIVTADLTSRVNAATASVTSLSGRVSTAETTIASQGTSITALTNQRGAANGLAPLNGSSLVPVANIPDLAAAKITSGSFDAARIPTLDAAKIGSGTFDAARIPSLDAAKVGSGTFDAARIPTLATSKVSGLDTALSGKYSTSGGAISGNVSVTGDITASGNITAYSDRRLKSNIATIEGGLEKILAMRGVTYDRDGKRWLGVIAQEVQEVLPEAVVDNGQYLSVAYGNIVGVLIEAVKELAARSPEKALSTQE